MQAHTSSKLSTIAIALSVPALALSLLVSTGVLAGNTGSNPSEAAQGPQGVAGVDGKNGKDGKDGLNGKNGQDGQDGRIGQAGAQGAHGAQGLSGPQGLQGLQGIPGVDGSSGFNALFHITSEANGSNCASGGKKIQYGLDTDGNGVLSSAEVVGTEFICHGNDGAQGEQGPTGPQGPAGPQGEQGSAGPTGPQGDTGPAGPQGPQGDQGPTGPAGPQGPQGEVSRIFAAQNTLVGGPQLTCDTFSYDAANRVTSCNSPRIDGHPIVAFERNKVAICAQATGGTFRQSLLMNNTSARMDWRGNPPSWDVSNFPDTLAYSVISCGW